MPTTVGIESILRRLQGRAGGAGERPCCCTRCAGARAPPPCGALLMRVHAAWLDWCDATAEAETRVRIVRQAVQCADGRPCEAMARQVEAEATAAELKRESEGLLAEVAKLRRGPTQRDERVSPTAMRRSVGSLGGAPTEASLRGRHVALAPAPVGRVARPMRFKRQRLARCTSGRSVPTAARLCCGAPMPGCARAAALRLRGQCGGRRASTVACAQRAARGRTSGAGARPLDRSRRSTTVAPPRTARLPPPSRVE